MNYTHIPKTINKTRYVSKKGAGWFYLIKNYQLKFSANTVSTRIDIGPEKLLSSFQTICIWSNIAILFIVPAPNRLQFKT